MVDLIKPKLVIIEGPLFPKRFKDWFNVVEIVKEKEIWKGRSWYQETGEWVLLGGRPCVRSRDIWYGGKHPFSRRLHLLTEYSRNLLRDSPRGTDTVLIHHRMYRSNDLWGNMGKIYASYYPESAIDLNFFLESDLEKGEFDLEPKTGVSHHTGFISSNIS